MANQNYCPCCGQPYNKKKTGKWKLFESKQTFGNVGAAALPVPVQSGGYQQRSHLPNRDSHFMVPVLQSVFVVGSTSLGVCAIFTTVAQLGNQPWGPSLLFGCGSAGFLFLIGTPAFFMWRLGGYDRLLHREPGETVSIEMSEPEKKKEEIQLDIAHRKEENGPVVGRTRPTLTDVSDEALALWAGQVSRGIADISEENWTGENKPFNKTAYRAMLETMRQNGIVFKNGTARNSKWLVTQGGRAALRSMAKDAENRVRSRQTDGRTNNFRFTEE